MQIGMSINPNNKLGLGSPTVKLKPNSIVTKSAGVAIKNTIAMPHKTLKSKYSHTAMMGNEINNPNKKLSFAEKEKCDARYV